MIATIAKNNGRCTNTRKETERKTKNRWKDLCKRDTESVWLIKENILDLDKVEE